MPDFQNDPLATLYQFLDVYSKLEIQKLTLFIWCKSDHHRLSFGCVKCLKSTIMSCNIKNRPEVLYKQAKVALDSYRSKLVQIVKIPITPAKPWV